MQLSKLRIRNFRALKSIELQTRNSPRAIVIAGPNAVGKSTILEAIRLAKVLLSPTFRNETELTLRDMGLLPSSHTAIDWEQVAADKTASVDVELTLDISDDELAFLQASVEPWARRRLAGQLGAPTDNVELLLIQYLSSKEGRDNLTTIQSRINTELEPLRVSQKLHVHMRMDPKRGVSGVRLFDQEAFAILSTRAAENLGLINYFPADRAMPAGEAQIQVGNAEFVAQLHAQIAQPGSKYSRLKQYLVSRYLLGDTQRTQLQDDFRSIFEKLLHDKRMEDLRLTNNGRLSVTITDNNSGARYDIDRMSSGEKGLILTLLLMKRTTAPGGLLLVDEPELHLNSAVCRNLLPYIVDEILTPMGIQAIICTHSEEILANAYSRADCNLFHLRSSTDASRIEAQDREELEEACKALGSSAVDMLSFSGTIYVEGVDDSHILQAGFPDRVSKWRIVPLHGRQEVEKHIKRLQEAEREGQLDTAHVFIFDHDNKPSDLKSSAKVQVLQWDRYCLENYLLDPDAIFDTLKDSPRAEELEFRRGTIGGEIRAFAMAQLPIAVLRKTYNGLSIQDTGLKLREFVDPAKYEAVGQQLGAKLAQIRDSLNFVTDANWPTEFANKATEIEQQLKDEWDAHWERIASGKLVIERVHAKYRVRIDRTEFKMRIAKTLRQRSAEPWKLVDRMLDDATKSSARS